MLNKLFWKEIMSLHSLVILLQTELAVIKYDCKQNQGDEKL